MQELHYYRVRGGVSSSLCSKRGIGDTQIQPCSGHAPRQTLGVYSKFFGSHPLHLGEKTVVRKICTSQQLQMIAASHDFVEWRTPVIEEHVLLLQDQLAQTECALQQMTTQYETALAAPIIVKGLGTLN